MRYLCALPNIKRPGRIPELFLEDDDEGLEAFRAKWDKEGWGVFECVSPLKPGSRRRNLENVAALAQFHVDVDFKDLTESPDEVRAKLLSLPLEPTEVRSSGGGYHLVWALKEPVEAGDPDFAGACALLRQLTQRLGGDPAPAHPAALLRLPGTTNSKREPHVQVTPQWGSGAPVDITEVGTLVDLLGERTLLTPKAMARPKTNGHCHNDVFVPDPEAVPVDVDQRLAHMEFGGAGEAGIHVTQVSATAALLCRGVGVEEAVATVLEATQRAVAGDPRVSSWDWDEEQRGLEQMCFAWVNKHPELSNVLPDKLREPFERHLAEGRGAQITFASTAGGWHARGRKHRLNGVEGAAAPKRLSFKLRPFVPIDPATLPPRQWLYGKHFQRRTVSATVAPGGFGRVCAWSRLWPWRPRATSSGSNPAHGCGSGITTATTVTTS